MKRILYIVGLFSISANGQAYNQPAIQQLSDSSMTYVIQSKDLNNDGSFVLNVFYWIDGSYITSSVNFPNTCTDSNAVRQGIINQAMMFDANIRNKLNGQSIYNSIILDFKTVPIK